MAPQLPDDVLHMICIQLRLKRDFNTLATCVTVSKTLALSAVANLYRIHDEAPITATSGFEDGTFEGQRKQERDIFLMWARVWKTLLLSSLGKTFFSYCHYIRTLVFGDLRDLIDDPKVIRTGIASELFEGDLSIFTSSSGDAPQTRARSGTKFYNSAQVIERAGDILTEKAYMVEELAGDLDPAWVQRWIPRLKNLTKLRCFNGEAISCSGQLLEANCPKFTDVAFYRWNGPETDNQFATFLLDLKPDSLESLAISSSSDAGLQTLQALNKHSATIRKLELGQVDQSVFYHLPELSGFTAMKEFDLSCTTTLTSSALDSLSGEAWADISNWFKSLRGIDTLKLHGLGTTANILEGLLHDSTIRLSALEISNYNSESASKFHDAIASQSMTLRKLRLVSGEGESCDTGVLAHAISQLRHLEELHLQNVSEFFTNTHITSIAKALPRLKTFVFSGWEISDAIWPALAKLTSLVCLEIYAFSNFTWKAIIDSFIDCLGTGNKGLRFAIMMQNPEKDLNLVEQEKIRTRL